jgi:hypothetical protein
LKEEHYICIIGIDAEPLVGIQVDYNMQTEKQNKFFAARLAEIRKMAAVF